MKILVSIACWNAPDIVRMAIDAVRNQTVTVDEILVVDNGSNEPLQTPADTVTLVRNPLNLGISGAVITGFEHARTHGYDWIWLLDADSNPPPDTLERLIELLRQTRSDQNRNIAIVSPSHNLINLGQLLRGRLLTPGGPRVPRTREDKNYIACDSVIWCGALINLDAVASVGMPRAGTRGCWEDLSIDYGDIEYTHRIHKAGYQILVHRDTIIEHRLGNALRRRILGRDFHTSNHSAFRRYLYFRNLVYFWLRLYPRRNWPLLLIWFSFRFSVVLAGIVFLERQRRSKLQACLVGIRDGLLGRLDRNFGTSV